MLRFIVILVGIFLVFLLLKGYFRNLQRSTKTPADPKAVSENMVRCAQCGVNTPVTEAVFSRGKHYCCDQHRQLDQQ